MRSQAMLIQSLNTLASYSGSDGSSYSMRFSEKYWLDDEFEVFPKPVGNKLNPSF